MNLQKFANDILEKILKIVRQEKNMEKIHNKLIDPLISYTYRKIYPYIITLFSLLILIFLIIIIILLFILKLYFFRKVQS